MRPILPTHFRNAIEKIKELQDLDTCLGAFVFGSAARGEVTKDSDLDVKVIVSNSKGCTSISHPFINDIKLDINFLSLDLIEKFTKEDIEKGERIPMIAESIIIFDKTGQLKQLKKKAVAAKPKKITNLDPTWIQYMVYHATNKAKRHLISDPLSSLLSLDSNLEELLKFHYQLNRRWWLSNKRLLKDIREWDPKLNILLEKFLLSHDVHLKFKLWEKIASHVLIPLGGPKPVADINCDCPVCQKHLKNLQLLEK